MIRPTHTRPSRFRSTIASPRKISSGACLRCIGGRLRTLLRLGFGLRLLALLRAGRQFRQPRGGAEPGDTIARRGAVAEPVLDPLLLEDNAIGVLLLQHRVVGAEHLDEAAVARASRVGYDYPIEGALLGAAPRQANSHAHASAPLHPFSVRRTARDPARP